MTHWACHETQTAALGDKRLNHRLTFLLQQLGDHPEDSIPTACGDWAATPAAYRFLGNEKVTFESVLESHKRARIERIREQPVVLLWQDTTALKYTETPVPKGLGTLSDQDHEKVFLHPTVAVTPQRVCLGVLGGDIWQRTTPSPRLERRQKTIAEKESHRWVTGYQLAGEVRRGAEQTLIVNIADAEGDIYEWFTEASQEPAATRAEWLIRAGQDRRLASSEKDGKLRQKLLKRSSLGEVGVRLPAKPGQVKRDALLEVRATKARLRAPARIGQQLKDLDVYAGLAVEKNPPPSHEPMVWMLLTSLPVTHFAQAVQVLEWYSCRWEIEVFFKVLKTGCRVEQLQLETLDRLEPCIALYLMVAWRILFSTHWGREAPQQSCELVFSREEWQATYLLHELPVPTFPPTLGDMLVKVAKLGGYLNRRSDGPPGPQTLWKGLRRVREAVWLLQVLKRTHRLQ